MMNPFGSSRQDVLPALTLNVDALDLNLDVTTFSGGAEEQYGDLGVPAANYSWGWCGFTRRWPCGGGGGGGY